MRGFLRRHRLLIAIVLGALVPFPSMEEFAPAGLAFIVLVLAGGFIGSGHAGVGVGGPALVAGLLVCWAVYAVAIYVALGRLVGRVGVRQQNGQ